MNAKRQIPFGRPWIEDAERQAVLEVLNGPILTHGPRCHDFEAAFAGFVGEGCHAVTTSSCMAALHLAWFEAGLGPGDEVITPAMTHVATAHAVELTGARPVFVDCEPATGNLDCARLESLVSERTKAITLVHFLGVPCDMDAVMAVAERHGLLVVEDCALAVGARYKGTHVGLFGRAGCFSFYPVKHITTAEGGMYISRRAEVAARAAHLRAFGVDRTHSERKVPGQYDVTDLGLNYRMSEMQAAIGIAQMRRVPEILSLRAANFSRLKQGLDGLAGLRVLDAPGDDYASSHYCLTAVLGKEAGARRLEIVAGLNQAGVGTSIYYPQPVPRMTYYREKYGYRDGSFPNAEAISDRSIALPVGPHLNAEDMDYIAEVMAEVLRANS